MDHTTRWIGLSLGADICWPICFEEILRRLDLDIVYAGERVSLDVERVTIEPFALDKPVKYDVVIDRLTHWYHTSREWIKKAVVLNDVYVFNNPWTLQSMEKHTSYCAMMRLGMPVPNTWMLPPKAYVATDDLKPTLQRYARLFDLGDVGRQLGYPMFMKPYDGGAWRGVSKIADERTLRDKYEESGTLVMHLQKAVDPFDSFVRCIGLGPQTRLVDYDPAAPLHDRYRPQTDFLPADQQQHLRDITLTINAFFGWDFNSCESLRQAGRWYPIDFANACPDSQVTSLHYHFPWLIKANLRWAIFNAVVRRGVRHMPDWQPFFEVADDPDRGFEDKLKDYVALAHQRFETERFEAFCAEHLGHLDEVADAFFGSEHCRDAVRQKVEVLFPAHEVAEFTELFYGRIQSWREVEGRPR